MAGGNGPDPDVWLRGAAQAGPGGNLNAARGAGSGGGTSESGFQALNHRTDDRLMMTRDLITVIMMMIISDADVHCRPLGPDRNAAGNQGRRRRSGPRQETGPGGDSVTRPGSLTRDSDLNLRTARAVP